MRYLQDDGNYKNNIKTGKFARWHNDGRFRSVTFFRNGEIKSMKSDTRAEHL